MANIFEKTGMPKALSWGFLGVLIFMMGDGIEQTWLSRYITDAGFNSAELFSVYGITVAISSWLSGVIAESWGVKRTMLAGFILSFPLIAYEAFAFILPGLKTEEKAVLFRFLPPVILFFLAGICFAFFIVLPAAIPFLTSFMGIKTEIRPSDYISFSTNLIFWIGIVFEMPVIIFIAARLHIVRSAQLLKNWRQAVVVCAVLAMLITPTVDPVNMLLMMVPLIALYFLSILGAKLAEQKS